MVKQYKKSASIIVDFKLSAHRLLNSSDKSACQDDVIYRITVELANIIRPRLGIHYHSYSDRSKHLGFPWLVLLVAPLVTVPATRPSVI